MPKRSGKPSSDPAVAAFRAVARMTGRSEDSPAPVPVKKNPHAVALGRKGGKIGGTARAKNLTAAELSEIGRLGAEKRWGKQPKK